MGLGFQSSINNALGLASLLYSQSSKYKIKSAEEANQLDIIKKQSDIQSQLKPYAKVQSVMNELSGNKNFSKDYAESVESQARDLFQRDPNSPLTAQLYKEAFDYAEFQRQQAMDKVKKKVANKSRQKKDIKQHIEATSDLNIRSTGFVTPEEKL